MCPLGVPPKPGALQAPTLVTTLLYEDTHISFRTFLGVLLPECLAPYRAGAAKLA